MVAQRQTTYTNSQVRAELTRNGWHIARETLAELSDALFGETVRPKGGGHRRWTSEQVDQLVTIGRIRQQTGLTLEEIVEAATADDAAWGLLVEERRRRCEAEIRDLGYIRQLISENREAP